MKLLNGKIEKISLEICWLTGDANKNIKIKWKMKIWTFLIKEI